MDDLPDSQQSFEEVWTSSFPSNREGLLSGLNSLDEITDQTDLGELQADLDELFPDIAEITAAQSDTSIDIALEAVADQENLLDSPIVLDHVTSDVDQTASAKFCMPDLPGLHGFEVNFGEPTYAVTKSTNFVHSKALNKLYVRMDQVCPIQFQCAANPPGCTIRVVPMFKKAEHSSELVTPCLFHRDKSEVHPNSGYRLIHAEMPLACSVTYSFTPEGRESVSCSCDSGHSNMERFILCYKFTCLSSCKSGINRRPVVLIFTLEDANGEVLGRQSVDLCICACPGRDRVREEDKQKQTKPTKKLKRPCTSVADNASLPKQKTESSNSSDDEVFVLTIRGRKKYEKLLEIKEALDLAELVSPEERRKYFSKENS